MKKVIVVGSKDSGTKNSPESIAQSLMSDNVEVAVVYWEDIVFSIAGNEVSITIDSEAVFDSADLVLAVGWYKNGSKSIYRDAAYSLALYLRSRNIEFWNSEMIHQRSTSKLSCMVQLALAGIPVPDTDFSLDAANLTANIKANLPVVVKAVSASRGESNFLVETVDELDEKLGLDGYFMVQPFMPNDHDLRVICFGGQPKLVMRRARQADAGTHLNNTSQGGSAEWLSEGGIPEGVLTLSERICMIMNREMAGVDLIPDSNSEFGYSCLEVNAIPQLTSGHDTDIKMNMLRNVVSGD